MKLAKQAVGVWIGIGVSARVPCNVVGRAPSMDGQASVASSPCIGEFRWAACYRRMDVSPLAEGARAAVKAILDPFAVLTPEIGNAQWLVRRN